jgi:hypothetical protein
MTSGRDGRRPDEPPRPEHAALSSSDSPQQAGQGKTVTYTCECCNWTSTYDQATFDLLMRDRVAQGLPFHVTDPVVLAKVAALIRSEVNLTDEERARRAEYARQEERRRAQEREARKAQAVVYYVHKGNRIKIGTTTVGEKRWKAHGGAFSPQSRAASS